MLKLINVFRIEELMDIAKIKASLDQIKELSREDFVMIENYGGGNDESFLKGTRVGLAHFALDILQASLGEVDKTIDVNVDFHKESVAIIDYVKVVEKMDELKKPESFKDKLIKLFFLMIVIFFVFTFGVGFFSIFSKIFS